MLTRSLSIKRVFQRQVEVVNNLPPFVFSYSIHDDYFNNNIERKTFVLFYDPAYNIQTGTYSFTVSVFYDNTLSSYRQDIIYNIYYFRPQTSSFSLTTSVPSIFPTLGVPPFLSVWSVSWNNNFYDPITIVYRNFSIPFPQTLSSPKIEFRSYFLNLSGSLLSRNTLQEKIFSTFQTKTNDKYQSPYFRYFAFDVYTFSLQERNTKTNLDSREILLFDKNANALQKSTSQDNKLLFLLSFSNIARDFYVNLEKRLLQIFSLSLEEKNFQNFFENRIFYFVSLSNYDINFQSYIENLTTYINTLTSFSIENINFLEYRNIYFLRFFNPLRLKTNIENPLPFYAFSSIFAEGIYNTFQDFNENLLFSFSLNLLSKTTNFEKRRFSLSFNSERLISQNTFLEFGESLLFNYTTTPLSQFSLVENRNNLLFSLDENELSEQTQYENRSIYLNQSTKTQSMSIKDFPENRTITLFIRTRSLDGRGTVLFEDPYFDANIYINRPEFIIY